MFKRKIKVISKGSPFKYDGCPACGGLVNSRSIQEWPQAKRCRFKESYFFDCAGSIERIGDNPNYHWNNVCPTLLDKFLVEQPCP